MSLGTAPRINRQTARIQKRWKSGNREDLLRFTRLAMVQGGSPRGEEDTMEGRGLTSVSSTVPLEEKDEGAGVPCV